ncbi:hypothetical protein AT864_00530 [Anoxybacillus sp. P3H1B]|jgi:hypothetical protein|uniref:hypothetical protein n=1 Tax=Anoxybacillaceae TaxID=3120669 RepID=UPI00079BBAF9|nr:MULTISPECIES: hypothetical protein [Anoxybacillus]KXG11447.1 hypothetical protein AT864_00530 [Anoxybacillus sp. P3H1B]MBB3907225.1 hypothetical protein [Anoxybacillus rupiensis]
MNEQVVRKIIQAKLKIGTSILNKMPQSLKETSNLFLRILAEELPSVPKTDKKTSNSLKNISID